LFELLACVRKGFTIGTGRLIGGPKIVPMTGPKPPPTSGKSIVTVAPRSGVPTVVPVQASAARARVWRHQVLDSVPLAGRVTEYQLAVRRCAAHGKRTRADLPAGGPPRLFGARLTRAVEQAPIVRRRGGA
jgi:hypothetical protein